MGFRHAETQIASAQDNGAVRQFQLFKDRLGAACHAVMFGGAVFRARDADHFDLFELVLTQHAGCIAACRSCFGPETLGVGHVATGQVAFVDGESVDNIGQCDLSSWDQPPTIRCLIAVFAKFRQLTGAIHHFFAHQDGRDRFRQPVFLDMHVQHELRQRAVQARNGAGKQNETAAGKLGRSFEIHPGADRGNVKMLYWIKIEVARVTIAVDFNVIVFIRTVRDGVIRQVRYAHEHIRQSGIFGLCLIVQCGYLRFLLANQRAEPFELGLITTAFGSTYFFCGLVCFGLRGLSSKDLGAARFVDGQNLGRHRCKPTARQGRIKSGGVVTDGANIMHSIGPL